jgi:predicted DCC family thiol-disulfide oxidoreductase YuxK
MGRGQGLSETDELFYDGGCGLCHSAVRFVLNRGEAGRAFRFAPLGGETFRQRLSAGQRAGLPDSVVILAASGEVLTRSRAVLRILHALGGGWRLLGWMGQVLPRILADALYDFLASIRHRHFAKPVDVCPGLSDEERTRFDA